MGPCCKRPAGVTVRPIHLGSIIYSTLRTVAPLVTLLTRKDR